ncbi:hypothetical protein ONZ45_g17404 [Pleurotus djamor]|nr:hypothetical protein ONZ45_g17404 [Pleurotus djamor]
MPLRYAVVMYGLHLVDLADSLNPSSHLLLRHLSSSSSSSYHHPSLPPRLVILERLWPHAKLFSGLSVTPSPRVCHISMAGRRVKHPRTVVAPLRSQQIACAASLLDRATNHLQVQLLGLSLITQASTSLFDRATTFIPGAMSSNLLLPGCKCICFVLHLPVLNALHRR